MQEDGDSGMTSETDLIFDPQLASTPSNLTINYFYKIHQDGALILRPPFQRNMVWNPEQQTFLIDSILRGLPVPEIYVQTETSAEGDESTVVVDGQQRISACISFIDGELRLEGVDELGPRWKGRTFPELDEDLRRRFRTYELIARKLPSVGDSVLREIFRRLNKTVEPLEAQELRHAAYTGPFIRLIEDAGKNKTVNDLGVFSAKDYLRRRSDELIGEIAYAVISKAFPNKKDGLDELFLTYEKQGISATDLQDLDRRFGRVFSTFEPIASALRRTRFRNKSDFYSLFIFLARNASSLPFPESEQEQFLDIVKRFSSRVNDIKKEEASGRSTEELTADDFGTEAAKYLRAVERAASDRLNRIRRDQCLHFVLDPLLASLKETALTELDSRWRLESEQDSQDDEPADEERAHTREVLLRES